LAAFSASSATRYFLLALMSLSFKIEVKIRKFKKVSETTEATGEIRLIGQDMEHFEVPASILVRVLGGLQQIVYLLAATQEDVTINQRFRLSSDIQQRYTLRCQVPKAGSYAIPITLKPNTGSQLSFLTEHQKILDGVQQFLLSLTDSGLGNIKDYFPDHRFRNLALREARKFLPKADENWSLGFSVVGKEEVFVTNKSISFIDEHLTQDTLEDEIMTVTGELVKIDFEKRVISLKYSANHREIECIYLEELENSLIENRRQMIQVTGKFTIDNKGILSKLTDVSRIEPLDLSYIRLQEVSFNSKTLIFNTPLVLQPKLDEESKQLLIVEDSNIGLDVFAYTREDLIHEINDQVMMMWEEYAQADPNVLASDARQLQKKLLNAIKEVKNV
jgi:hypothetical protein